MHNQVIADIEIEDQKIEYYSSVVIRQQFNAHHEFAIRIKYDVLEKIGSFGLSNAQKLIGKTAIIKLTKSHTLDVAYEFRGMICEISMEQSDNFTSDLVLKGYSPTILLENGPNLLSFYKKSLKDIANTLTEAVTDSNCKVTLAPHYKNPIIYICQYRESTFHFLNRLSSDFGEWFYYDGKELFFGKPSSSPTVDITYGENLQNVQMTLRIQPMTFSSYAYVSKDDKLVTSNAPSSVDGLDQYASFALKESNKIFSTPVNMPVRQRVENKGDLDAFLKKQKAAMAANLEVLTGTSDNPALCIGAIANVKFSKFEDSSITKEDYGKFLITSIEHHVTDNGKYYNSFEAIPSGMEIIPVTNINVPIAESQIATVKDNKDPDNMGRVRVEMLWQQPLGEMTDWLRVMTPDAGGGKGGGGKNRGLVVVPEVGDQVLICFRYNDPDRPFVMGSMFHGKTGGGGKGGNNMKSLSSKSGHIVELNDGGGISIIDKSKLNHVVVDGTNKVTVTGNGTVDLVSKGNTITITSEDGKIQITSATVINIKSPTINIGDGTDTINIKAKDININATNTNTITGTNIEIQGKNNHIHGVSKLDGGNVFIN